ncbi:MAG TPA: ABC-type transport auxiliary lipoprotein family protein [Roseiarcus sp.]|nr:ABC-type transport auxiliary lipoprotein family protein [Roseiarcus sp.]
METHARYLIVGVFTILALVAGFYFVYWLHTTGGMVAQQAFYRIRFEAPVIGLRSGVAVLFNGMRVGEVRDVRLDPSDPKLLLASVAVDPATPVGDDTRVGVETAGLLGSINLSLTGGSSQRLLTSGANGEPPLLLADPAASESLGQAAKDTLNKIDVILNDNATAVRNAIANISAFSDALARNSGRVDKILAGLEKMTGGAPPAPPPFYDLSAPKIPPADKASMIQIVVAEPTALVMFETQRALVSPKAGQRRPLEGGQWSDSLPIIVRAKIVEMLENAGFVRVAAAREGLSADIQVALEIRGFEVTLDPTPVARVDLAVKLIGAGGKIIGARNFEASSPAASVDANDAFAALNQAFGKAAYDFGTWMETAI